MGAGRAGGAPGWARSPGHARPCCAPVSGTPILPLAPGIRLPLWAGQLSLWMPVPCAQLGPRSAAWGVAGLSCGPRLPVPVHGWPLLLEFSPGEGGRQAGRGWASPGPPALLDLLLGPYKCQSTEDPPPHAEVGLASGTLPGGRRSEPLLRLLLSLACEVRESPSAPAGPPADQAAGVEAGPGSRLGPGCLCRSSNRPWPPPAGRPSRSEQRGRTEARGGSFLRLCPRGQAKFLAWGHVPGVLVLLGAAGPAGVPALLVEQGPCLVVSRTRWGWRKTAICKRPHGPAPVSLGPLAPSWPCARHSRSAVTGLVPVSRASRHPAPGLVGHRPLGSPRALPPE